MPVSCGRGETSLNMTSSPLTNSSTPKMPRPPRSSVILPAISRAAASAVSLIGCGCQDFDVVAVDLDVADRVRRKLVPSRVPHREQGDLVVEVDEALDDDLAGAGAAAFLRVCPGAVDVRRLPERALALAGGGHDRLDDAGQADGLERLVEFLASLGKAVGRGRQPELLGGQTADALAVHGEVGGARGRDDGVALGLELHQGVGGDGLDLRDDEVRLLLLDHSAAGHRRRAW